jgi:hypothetical protein
MDEREDLELAFASIGEALRGLQANQIAQTRLLRAMLKTHPDPESMRAAWRDFSAPLIADAEMSKAGDPGRLAAHQARLEALREWDARVQDDLARP